MTTVERRHRSTVVCEPTSTARLGTAAAAVSAGRTVVLFDPASGEANLVFAAEFATTAALAFMIRHTSGFVKVTVTEDECVRMQLPPMWALPESTGCSDLAVTVDAVDGIGTGISATDRACTIRTIADPATGPADLSRPGHVAPVIARGTGAGLADAVVRIMRAAGVRPVGALCELVSPSNETAMASEAESIEFGRRHGLAFVSVNDVMRDAATSIAPRFAPRLI
ncbi:3,4-dihydroxy-2-butanone-4-phosphate synthase [Rhodococcus koreensis]